MRNGENRWCGYQAVPYSGKLGTLIGKVPGEQRLLKERLDALSKLDECTDFSELDWQSLAVEIAILEYEKKNLESASDLLQSLTLRLKRLQADLGEAQKELEKKAGERGASQAKREAAEASSDYLAMLKKLKAEHTDQLREGFRCPLCQDSCRLGWVV